MRFVVSVLGRPVIEISTESDAPPPAAAPRLEAASGGQFEIGFTGQRAIVECLRELR